MPRTLAAHAGERIRGFASRSRITRNQPRRQGPRVRPWIAEQAFHQPTPRGLRPGLFRRSAVDSRPSAWSHRRCATRPPRLLLIPQNPGHARTGFAPSRVKSRRNLACGDITLRPSAEWYILTGKPTSEEEMEVGAGFPVHHGGRLPRYAT